MSDWKGPYHHENLSAGRNIARPCRSGWGRNHRWLTGCRVEFRLANSLLNAPIAGLAYYDDQEFGGEPLVLRLSQSGSYSVAGGLAFYGENWLGAVDLVGPGAVPEPGTWALLILGFGAVGAALRRRPARVAVVYS